MFSLGCREEESNPSQTHTVQVVGTSISNQMSTSSESKTNEKTADREVLQFAAKEPRAKRPRCTTSFEWNLYPPPNQFSFASGDSVIYKCKGKEPIRGFIVSILPENQGLEIETDEDTDTTSNSRIVVKDARRLVPLFRTPTVVVMPETNHFRAMAYQVQALDTVLEIGCSSGETSRLLIPRVRSWVGLDTSDEMIEQCRHHVLAEKKTLAVKVDALIDHNKALESANTFGNPNVVFVDIGGNRETINVLRMISWVLESFDPRLVIVKSKELVQSIQSIPNVDARTGLVPNGDKWFQQHMITKRAMPKHPLRAPLTMSPKDGMTPICRYYNYHKEGCSKLNCPFDHIYCHACQRAGHIALQCPTLD
jgi:SAM-dependent methyltransferase